VNDIALRLFETGVINLTRIPYVLDVYKHPPHDRDGKTAWRLFNAVTFILAGKVAENPAATPRTYGRVRRATRP
jgi:hypothetical protein